MVAKAFTCAAVAAGSERAAAGQLRSRICPRWAASSLVSRSGQVMIQRTTVRGLSGGGVVGALDARAGSHPHRDRGQHGAQQRRVPGMRAGQPLDLLSEHRCHARGIHTLEPAYRHRQHRSQPSKRSISQPPDVPAVHPSRGLPALRALRLCRPNQSMQCDHIHRPLEDLNDDPDQVREKIINTPRTRSTTARLSVTRSATEPDCPYVPVYWTPYADTPTKGGTAERPALHLSTHHR